MSSGGWQSSSDGYGGGWAAGWGRKPVAPAGGGSIRQSDQRLDATNAAAITLTLDVAPVAGDLLLAAIGKIGYQVVTPAGWTELASVFLTGQNGVGLTVMGRIALLGDPASWSFPLPGSGAASYGCMGFLAELTGTSMPEAVTGTSNTSGVIVTNEVSTSKAGVALAAAFNFSADGGAMGYDYTVPVSGWSVLANISSTTLYGCLAVATFLVPSGGEPGLEVALDYTPVNSYNPQAVAACVVG